MKSLYLIKILSLIVLFSFGIQNAHGQTSICDDTFDYELLERDGGLYSIQLSTSFKGDYIFKLFDITGKAVLVETLNSTNYKNQKIIFSGLSKKSYFLIHAISLDKQCRFTIGGMEAIKFEN